MAKSRVEFRCDECGGAAPQWAGRCPACGAWNALSESPIVPIVSRPLARVDPAVPIYEVDMTEWSPRPTGIGEFDRVLAGGLVPGSVTVLGGEPGIGKSTLLTQTSAAMA